MGILLRKTLAFTAVLLMALAILAYGDIGKRYTTHGAADLFASPKGKVKLGTLGLNSEVSLLEVEGDWAHISISGWVKRDCLSERPVKEAESRTAAGRGFYYSNVAFVAFTDSITKCVGEMSNRSGKDYEAVWFIVSVYGAEGALLNTESILIRNFADGEVRSFDTYVDVETNRIDKYRIQFDHTY